MLLYRMLSARHNRKFSSSFAKNHFYQTRRMETYFAEHTEDVNAPFDIVWQGMLDKIYHPNKFVPGVTEVEIVGDKGHAEGVERKMWAGGAPFPIHELITTRVDSADKRTVLFKMITHPVVEGQVLNVVERVPGDDKMTKITFIMQWTRRADAPADAKLPFPSAQIGITRAVQKSKEVCESMVPAV